MHLLQKLLEGLTKPLGTCHDRYRGLSRHMIRRTWSILLSYAILLLLKPSLEGSWFTIRTDHDAPRLILNMTGSTVRPGRWRLQMSESTFEVVQCAAIKHQAADALSHLSSSRLYESSLRVDLPVLTITKAQAKGGKRNGRKDFAKYPGEKSLDTVKPAL